MTEHHNTWSQAMAAYLIDIQDYAPLSRRREAELARRIRDGDEDALDELVTANLRFAIKTAKEYTEKGLSLIELISEANWGLCQAARRFDERQEIRPRPRR